MARMMTSEPRNFLTGESSATDAQRPPTAGPDHSSPTAAGETHSVLGRTGLELTECLSLSDFEGSSMPRPGFVGLLFRMSPGHSPSWRPHARRLGMHCSRPTTLIL